MAVIFALSAVAFSAFVVYDMSQSRKRQEALSAAQNPQQQQGQNGNCSIMEPVSGVETLPVPEAFSVPGKTESLQVTPLSEGTGEAAKKGDCLVMKYYGTLASDGTKFDENFTEDKALQFTLGNGEVIQGWDNGLEGMKVGETRRIVIPSAQAYGDSGSGTIPANSDLVFHVKLLTIK
jgi:FKBP-type peptidyl-prolyl cis-trans isomerase